MQLFRLQSLQIYQNMRVPDWGPSIEGLNMDNIVTYVRPNTGMKAKWSDVPEDIKNTFERLGHSAGGTQIAGGRGRAV